MKIKYFIMERTKSNFGGEYEVRVDATVQNLGVHFIATSNLYIRHDQWNLE